MKTVEDAILYDLNDQADTGLVNIINARKAVHEAWMAGQAKGREDGMREAVEIVETTMVSSQRPRETGHGYFHRICDSFKDAILSAIERTQP